MIRRLAVVSLLALALAAPAFAQSRSVSLLTAAPLAAAGTYTGDVVRLPFLANSIAAQAVFVRAGGGTTTKAYLQTSLDGGVTWVDVAALAFTTTNATKISSVKATTALAAAYVPTDGTLTDDTIKDGLVGDRLRVKWVVAGTYTGASSLTVTVVIN